MDFLLPVVNVGLHPNGKETSVSLYPNGEEINVSVYNIGEMSPSDFFPNPNVKKK